MWYITMVCVVHVRLFVVYYCGMFGKSACHKSPVIKLVGDVLTVLTGQDDAEEGGAGSDV